MLDFIRTAWANAFDFIAAIPAAVTGHPELAAHAAIYIAGVVVGIAIIRRARSNR